LIEVVKLDLRWILRGGEKFLVVFEKFLWICKIALNIKSLSNSQKGIKDSFLKRTKIYGKKSKKKRAAFI